MKHLSERINRLSPSATLAMSQKSSDMQAQGIDVINLSVGEPDFNTPQHIKEEGSHHRRRCTSAAHGHTHCARQSQADFQ